MSRLFTTTRARTCALCVVHVHVQLLWVTVARDHACLKAERSLRCSVRLRQLRRLSCLHIQHTAHLNIQQPTKIRRLRISTSALQGPLRAAGCSSLLQPARSAEGRQTAHLYFSRSWSAEGRQTAHLYFSPSRSAEGCRLRISTPAQQGPLRDEDCTSIHKEGMCKISCCWHNNMLSSPPPTVFRVISLKISIRRRRLFSEK